MILHTFVEVGRGVIVAGILAYLLIIGNKADLARERGWTLLVSSFACILVGLAVEACRHLGILCPLLSPSNYPVAVWVENGIGGVLGFGLLAAGLMRWIPAIAERKRVAGTLQSEVQAREQVQARLAVTLVESQQRQKESSALLLAACTMLEQQSLTQTSRFLFDACKNLIGAGDGYITLPVSDGQRDELPIVPVKGPTRSEALPAPPPLAALRDQACNTGRVVYANDLPDYEWTPLPGSASMAVSSLLLAPLLIKGSVVGLLGLVNKPGGFVDNDAHLAEAFADLIALGLYNRQLVEKLEASEQRLRSVVETASDAIVTANPEGLIVSWNRAAQAMFGYTEAEMIGEPLASIIPERFRAEHEAGLHRVAAGGAARIIGRTIEMVGRGQDGVEFPLELSLANWQTDEGTYFTAILRDVTERKRVQEALREANQALEGLIEASPLPILALTPQRTITLWNRAAEEAFGWTEQEVMGRVSPIVPTDKLDEFWTLSERALRGEALAGVETRRNRKDQTPVDISLWTAPLHDADGNVSGAVAVMADITARKEAEETLRRHADEQTALYTIAAAVAATLSLDELLPAVLDTTLAVLQADAVWILCPDSTHGDALRVMASRSSTSAPASLEVLLEGGRCPILNPGPDGSRGTESDVIADCDLPSSENEAGGRPVLEAGRHVCLPLTAAGRVLGVLKVAWQQPQPGAGSNEALLLTIGRQVGMALHNAQLYEAARQVDRLRILAELDRALAASLDWRRVAEETLHHIATQLDAPLSVLLLTLPGAVRSPEAMLVLWHGWDGSRQAADGRVWWPALEGKIELQAGTATLTGRELAAAGGEPELARRWGAGGLVAPIWGDEDLLAVLALGGRADDRPFIAEDGALLQVAAGHAGQALQNAHLYDELKRLLCERDQTRAQLIQSEKVAALGRLVASIAHEINNPLQAVVSYLTLAEEELAAGRQQDKLERYVHVVQVEIERISSIMHRLRDYYRPAHKGSQPILVQDVLQHVLELTAKELQRAGIEASTHWPSDLPAIPANPDHLKQVFLNLVLNAIDAMPGGGTLRIEATFDQIAACAEEPPAPAVRIEFRDSGQGMSAETQARLFEPFFTTKESGAGLGLYVSYGIIEAHHGRIQVSSQEGAGTVFHILLPALQPWSERV